MSRAAVVLQRLRSEFGLVVASVVLNAGTYAHTVIAARYLGVKDFGAFTAAMNVLIVLSVISLGLQTTVARRVTADPEAAPAISRAAMRLTYAAAAVLAVALGLLNRVLDTTLRLDSAASALLIAVAAAPMTIMGGQAGVLQGQRRWSSLAILHTASGGTRLLVGTALLVWRPTLPWAVGGIVAGMAAPALLGWWLLRADAARRPARPRASYSRLLGESLRGAQALLAFLALCNLDVVVARHALPDEASGLYAAGLVLSKAVLFLPQFILIRMFPALSTTDGRARALTASVGVIVVLGLGVASVAAVVPWLALIFVGGADFAAIQDILWVFAVLGSVQALVQLFIYSVLASAATGPTLATWAALLVLLPAGLRMDSVADMALLVISLNVTLLVVLVTMTRGSWARPSPRGPGG